MNRTALRQRSDYTYKANIKAGRHGWLRLTPAYGINLVYGELSKLSEGSRVIEPFSGSGTTPLAASELGLSCNAREINPFLVWLGNAKLNSYSKEDGEASIEEAHSVIAEASKFEGLDGLWAPPMHNITRWWDQASLEALAALRHEIDERNGKVRTLLDIAFCRLLIGLSAAAFNHQSMSFKDQESLFGYSREDFLHNVRSYATEVKDVVAKAMNDTPVGKAFVEHGDSTLPFTGYEPADLVITSPPYANRMSYIRELRPYMYWMRYLTSGEQAGEMDWKTIGGTWGSVGTKLRARVSPHESPIDTTLSEVCEKILQGKSGEILSPYVYKYFDDMWSHFKAITPVVKEGGNLCYIVGNSTFSGIEVPSHTWYAEMMKALGYHNVKATAIRKRNSNKQLYEYAVTATK